LNFSTTFRATAICCDFNPPGGDRSPTNSWQLSAYEGLKRPHNLHISSETRKSVVGQKRRFDCQPMTSGLP
jgi:hypothetical protein